MNRPSQRQAGMTLIEVLVSLLIFSFGLLGLVGLQARAIQFSVSAEDSNRAALLANDMATTMVTINSVDTTSALLSAAVPAWAARVATPASGGLPNGVGSVKTLTPNVASVTIKWQPTSAGAGATAPPNQYVTQVVLP